MGALTAAATGVVALTKQSIEGYAEYEQLVGGVETLFKTSADTVMEYANRAYQSAGLSANEYMSTVTSFSASLLQSLGGDTAAAANVADTAITDMADNANKMGTSIEMIQNAYQGFAKQNYTMLDNLKLGYGGTKEEMERLIEDANRVKEANGEMGDLSIESFADVVEAIHTMQTEMGITGTTAAEASGTISGSVAAMQSAWANLVAGIADENQNAEVLIDNFVNSTVTAAENLLPRIEIVLSGIGEIIERLAPIIAEKVPALIVEVLPNILNAGISLIKGLMEGIMTALPELFNTVWTLGMDLIDQLTTGIETGLPNMISRLPQIIDGFLDFITEKLPDVLEMGVGLITSLSNGILEGIPAFVQSLPEVITSFVEFIGENLPKIAEAGVTLVVNLAFGIIKAIPEIVKAIPKIIIAIVNGIKNLIGDIVSVGKNIVEGLWDGIVAMASWIKEKVGGFFSGIVDGVKDFLGIHSPSRLFAGIGENMALGVGEGWDGEYGRIKKDIENGMDFGTATVDFASSGVGKSSSGIINSVMTSAQSGGGVYHIHVEAEGRELAQVVFDPLRGIVKQGGVGLA